MSIEVMKQALAKFESLWEIGIDAVYKVELLPEIQALRQAIAQTELAKPEQKIIGWINGEPQYAKPEQELKNMHTAWIVEASMRNAKPEQAEKQEPVAYIDHVSGKPKFIDGYVVQTDYDIPLYTAPQKYCPSENNAAYEKGFVEGMAKQMHSSVDRAVNAMAKQWVGLTDDEIHKIVDACTPDEAEQEELNDFARAVRFAEAKLKEKNGG